MVMTMDYINTSSESRTQIVSYKTGVDYVQTQVFVENQQTSVSFICRKSAALYSREYKVVCMCR